MRWSQTFIPTLKEAPAEADAKSRDADDDGIVDADFEDLDDDKRSR